jgi:Flp pilus assembly protein TadD
MRKIERVTIAIAIFAMNGCGGPSTPARDIDPGFHVSSCVPDGFPCPPPTAAPSASIAARMPNAIPPSQEVSPATPAQLPPPKPTTLALAHPSDDPIDTQIVNGDRAFESGDWEAAKKAYSQALALAPKSAAANVGLARIQIAKAAKSTDFGSAKGNAEVLRATIKLRAAAKSDPAFGQAEVELGRALLLLGDATGAIESLRKGVSLLPLEAEAHSALGVGLLASGHADDAAIELARATELDPGSAPRRGNLGTVLFMRGKVEAAVKEYEVEVRLADGDARAHSDLGTALLAANDLARARTELERAVAIDPAQPSFHSNLGYALQLAGEMDRAILEYKEAIRLDPKLSSAWINLATALARDPKRRGEARAALEHARAIDPTDPRVKANLDELDSLEKTPSGNAPSEIPSASKKSSATPSETRAR